MDKKGKYFNFEAIKPTEILPNHFQLEGEKRNEYVDKARNEKIKKENMKKNENKYPENII